MMNCGVNKTETRLKIITLIGNQYETLIFFLIPFLFMDDSSCTDTPFFRPDVLWRENTVNYQMASPEKGLPPFDLANSRLGADFTLGAGYRWRLNRPDTSWLFDLSLSARYGRYSYGFRYLSSDVHTTYVGGEGIRNLWSASFAGSVGRYLFRGLNLSVGVEPTFYFYDKSFFDLPVFARLAYDFRFMEVAVQYKWGMTRKFNMSPFLCNRLSGWECSVYIPLSGRK